MRRDRLFQGYECWTLTFRLFYSSLNKELVHIFAIKYFWLDLMWEKWLCNNRNYRERLLFTDGNFTAFKREYPEALNGWPAPLTASTFNQLVRYANSPSNRIPAGVNRTYCHTELAAFSLAIHASIACTHCAYPQRDGQAELAWGLG